MHWKKAVLFLLPLWLNVSPSIQFDAECDELLNEKEIFPGFLYYRYTVNVNSTDTSKSTLKFQYHHTDTAWCGFGLAATPETMVGGEVVIGRPDDGNSVLKYRMDGRTIDMVVPMPEEEQTLMDTSIIQDEEGTKMTFTRYLEEGGQMAYDVDGGMNNVIGAIGSDNTFAAHPPDRRGGLELVLTPDCVDGVLVAKKEPDAPDTDEEGGSPPVDGGVTESAPAAGAQDASGSRETKLHAFPVLLAAVISVYHRL